MKANEPREESEKVAVREESEWVSSMQASKAREGAIEAGNPSNCPGFLYFYNPFPTGQRLLAPSAAGGKPPSPPKEQQ